VSLIVTLLLDVDRAVESVSLRYSQPLEPLVFVDGTRTDLVVAIVIEK
jgi:hypothetical protein